LPYEIVVLSGRNASEHYVVMSKDAKDPASASKTSREPRVLSPFERFTAALLGVPKAEADAIKVKQPKRSAHKKARQGSK
jgi:hypothetical protein